eukprot:TRINITY_DN3287_c0_g1_i1.p2 TRINITY_DN3287_c0_g1~~TRINITY_DN3287_c0_g1_i1.p2  ORF type:complete len:191 (+),score=42.28 TRINITY_DN3287_c0_g1_i1:41-574(+)
MVRHFIVVGRRTPEVPTASEDSEMYRMQIFAQNDILAKSRFWYFLSKLKKLKKANGQIVSVTEVFENHPTKVDNYAIWIRYQSRTGTHNMYKEYRDTTLTGAIKQMYQEMASRHRARANTIQVLKTAKVSAKDCRRANTQQFHDTGLKFPLTRNYRLLEPHKKYRTAFKASRPTTHY